MPFLLATATMVHQVGVEPTASRLSSERSASEPLVGESGGIRTHDQQVNGLRHGHCASDPSRDGQDRTGDPSVPSRVRYHCATSRFRSQVPVEYSAPAGIQ